jgi:site-specific DNA-methyltransferase (adenine-specific)
MEDAHTSIAGEEQSCSTLDCAPPAFPLTVPASPPPITVINGESYRALQMLAPGSIDAVICDPPYGIDLPKVHWDDSVLPGVALWRECYRVLRPGKRLLAFSAARMHHRLAHSIREAGFEILDMYFWSYTSAVPKSRNVSRGLDRLAGVERPIVDYKIRKPLFGGGEAKLTPVYSTEAISDLANRYEGWGTGLRPAHEPIVVARKPDPSRPGAAALAGEQIDAAVWGLGLDDDMSIEEKVLFAPLFVCPKPGKKERVEGGGHPTMKPIRMMEHLIKLVTRMGDVVLDPFAGSGTTGVAAMRLSRGAVLIEMDAHFYETILQRLEKHAAFGDGPTEKAVRR